MAVFKETYKGREIEIDQDGDEITLTIDGQPVEVHFHEDGSVESHDLMFQLFGSRAELARALIDQMPAV